MKTIDWVDFFNPEYILLQLNEEFVEEAIRKQVEVDRMAKKRGYVNRFNVGVRNRALGYVAERAVRYAYTWFIPFNKRNEPDKFDFFSGKYRVDVKTRVVDNFYQYGKYLNIQYNEKQYNKKIRYIDMLVNCLIETESFKMRVYGWIPFEELGNGDLQGEEGNTYFSVPFTAIYKGPPPGYDHQLAIEYQAIAEQYPNVDLEKRRTFDLRCEEIRQQLFNETR